VGTVKSRCARARARLAELLPDESGRSRNADAAPAVQARNEEAEERG
jgi:hypothetical protein